MAGIDLSQFEVEETTPENPTPIKTPESSSGGIDLSQFEVEEPTKETSEPTNTLDREERRARFHKNRQNRTETDEWALKNPNLDKLAQMEAARMVGEMERAGEAGYGNPEAEKRATLAANTMTLGAPQKIAGYSEVFEQHGFLGGLKKLLSSDAADEREYGERVHRYYIENLREDVPYDLAYELGGGLLTPGGARSVPKAIAEGAGLAAAETAMTNTPSEGLEGVGDAAIGGGAISGGLAVPGRTVATLPEKPLPDPDAPNIPEAPEQAGQRFQAAASDAIGGKKGALKDTLETAIEDGGVSYTDRAGARLQYHVRSNISEDLASMNQNTGLATNINDAVSPQSMAVLSEIDALAEEEVLDLRKLDNLMNSLRAAEKRATDKADKIILGKIRDRITSFTNIAEYEMIVGDSTLLNKVFDGDPQALADWKAAHAELGAFKDKFRQGGKGAEGRLFNIANDGTKTGRDIADYVWGLNKAGEKRYSKGMVNVIKETFGQDSELWNEYKRGMTEVLQSGTPAQTSKRIANFLENSPELASEIFTPKELKKLEKFKNQQSLIRERNRAARSKKGTGLGDLLNIGVFGISSGIATGNPAVGGTVALARAAMTQTAKESAFSQRLADGLAQAGKTGAINFGEETGQIIDAENRVEEYITDSEMIQNLLPSAVDGVE